MPVTNDEEVLPMSSQDLMNVGSDIPPTKNLFLLSLINKHKTGSGKPSTFKAPRSQLLQRVKDFLPEMQTAEELLNIRVKADASSVDIENIDDDDVQYIEMDIALVENAIIVSSDSECSDSSSESESDDDNATYAEITEHNLRTDIANKKKHKIEVLSDIKDRPSPSELPKSTNNECVTKKD